MQRGSERETGRQGEKQADYRVSSDGDDRKPSAMALADDSAHVKGQSLAQSALEVKLNESNRSTESKKRKPRQRRRNKRPSDMPKHPLTAYNFFFREQRAAMLEMRDEESKGESEGSFQAGGSQSKPPKGKALFAFLGKTIAKRWSKLTPSEAAKYKALAEEDMKRYRREMGEYQEELSKRSQLASQERVKVSESEPSSMVADSGSVNRASTVASARTSALSSLSTSITDPNGSSSTSGTGNMLDSQLAMAQQLQNQNIANQLAAMRSGLVGAPTLGSTNPYSQGLLASQLSGFPNANLLSQSQLMQQLQQQGASLSGTNPGAGLMAAQAAPDIRLLGLLGPTSASNPQTAQLLLQVALAGQLSGQAGQGATIGAPTPQVLPYGASSSSQPDAPTPLSLLERALLGSLNPAQFQQPQVALPNMQQPQPATSSLEALQQLLLLQQRIPVQPSLNQPGLTALPDGSYPARRSSDSEEEN